MYKINRRDLFHAGAGIALGAGPMASLAQAAGGGSSFSDYRALVCIYLYGGNDSFGMFIPTSAAEYANYASGRYSLAVPEDFLLPTPTLNQGEIQIGMHPSLPELKDLIDQERVALVTNVGTLLNPVSKDDFLNETVDIPPNLFSHNSQSDQWQSLKGLNDSATGWCGRISDLLQPSVSGQRLPVGVSLSGNPLILSANSTVPYLIGPDGPKEFVDLDDAYADYESKLLGTYGRVITDVSDRSLYEKAYTEVNSRSLQTVGRVKTAIENAQPVTTPFSNTELSRQLRTVAQFISARDELQMNRQIFFVGMGGFDTHSFQAQNQPALFRALSRGLSEFYTATQELGVAESVTTFTQSDFGRTLTQNGDGTDHGWGGIQMVMGGSVLGGKQYGTFPDISIGGPDVVLLNRVIPTLAADQYVATLAKWFGVADSGLGQVAPSLNNFAVRNLGFMA